MLHAINNKQFTKKSSSQPEVFCKKVVLKNFSKIQRTIPVSESLFNKVAGLRLATLLKKKVTA